MNRIQRELHQIHDILEGYQIPDSHDDDGHPEYYDTITEDEVKLIHRAQQLVELLHLSESVMFKPEHYSIEPLYREYHDQNMIWGTCPCPGVTYD